MVLKDPPKWNLSSQSCPRVLSVPVLRHLQDQEKQKNETGRGHEKTLVAVTAFLILDIREKVMSGMKYFAQTKDK